MNVFISSFHIEDVGEDTMVWWSSGDGNFNIQAAHSVITHPDLSPSDPLFKLIWKWEGMERIKSFLWLVVFDALRTDEFRVRCHISNSSNLFALQ